MTFTVKDFLEMLAKNERIIEIDIETKTTNPGVYASTSLVYDYLGERRTCDENIHKYADAVVLRTNTAVDDYGTICFILYIDYNDKNIKK